MALLLKSNAIFLHIPKTGGTYVSKVLESLDLVAGHVGREHANFMEVFWHDRFHADNKVFRNLVRRRLGLMPSIRYNAFTFCFVREPLSWYVSYWRFMESVEWKRWGDEGNPRRWHPTAMLNGLGDPDFNTFMRKVNRKRPGFVTELYGWYVRPGVDFVGRQETLEEDLARLLVLLGVKTEMADRPSLPRQNVSPEDRKAVWDPEVRRETLRLEYTGYLRHGYPWPGEDAGILADAAARH